jgi:signal transduction histidine kinase
VGPGLVLSATFSLLLFPTGSLPSRRWRPFAWVVAVAIGLFVIGSVFAPGLIEDTKSVNPIGIGGPLGSVFSVLQSFIVVALLGVVGAIASLIVRYVRADRTEREQLKWLVYAGAVILLALVAQAVVGKALGSGDAATDIENSIISLAVALVPIAAGVAVLKYRLYDIDVVINKTLVYGSLAGFITAVYVGIVVGIGAAIGQGTSKPNLGLSILATAVVAVAFQPVRERIQRFANRLVYGKRATPYEVLSEFGHRMAGTYAADDVLPRMARILGEGTGAKEARVWLAVSGGLSPAASWPDTSANGSSARPDTADLLVPVAHQGEDLGALSITKAPGERLTPAEEKLTRDLASQAGLVLRNVKLIEDLKASRVRLVQAQDEERRKIERNIHDGAQQQLVALQVKMGLAKRLTGDPEKLDGILGQLQEETNQALQDLRDLARGIYPPLLADQGLTAALEAQARKSPIRVTVEAVDIGRYSQDVEAAAYFCVLEALQNVAKYANASQATITLSARDGQLMFDVTDDGVGFDPAATGYGTGLQGMADRLAALGGGVNVESNPKRGTTVSGRVPTTTREVVG